MKKLIISTVLTIAGLASIQAQSDVLTLRLIARVEPVFVTEFHDGTYSITTNADDMDLDIETVHAEDNVTVFVTAP